MRRRKKYKLFINDLLQLTECNTEIEFIQLVGNGLTDSVKPVWQTVKGISEFSYYALNYPFVKFVCFDIKGSQDVLEYERIQ
jgi:hypothetical protein